MELDLRKQRILQAIVQDYVDTAEPVGSHILVERYALGVKSATIRNEMAEMSEQGYLRQPHTSAGRIPSNLGYRFYVNRLMVQPALREAEARRARTLAAEAASELDAILRRTCELLTQMTQLPAVATTPDADQTELRQVFVSPIAPDKALLVLLFTSGRTEHRLLPEMPVRATDARVLANALQERFGGRRLPDLQATDPLADPPTALTSLRNSWHRCVREIVATARSLTTARDVFVAGAQTVLVQPEFRDVERLGQFLSTLQERAALVEMMNQSLAKPDVTIRIGEEIGRPELSEYAVVASAYLVGGRERGSLGVVGPTRMDYGRASTAVRFLAQTVGDLLTRLSPAS